MPYQTASASQYTMIKRLQAGLNGKTSNTKPANKKGGADPLSYDGYAGYSIPVLPPNAVTSNKFIVEPILPIADYTINLNTNIGTTDQVFDGNFPIAPAKSFSFNVSNSALSGYKIQSFIICVSVNDYTIKDTNIIIPFASNILVSPVNFSNNFEIYGNLPSSTSLPVVTITGMLNGGSIKNIQLTYIPSLQDPKNDGMKV